MENKEIVEVGESIALQEVTGEADKSIEVESKVAAYIMLYPEYIAKHNLTSNMLRVLELLCQFADKQLDSDTKSNNGYILSGNETCLSALLNKEFTYSYVTFLKNILIQGNNAITKLLDAPQNSHLRNLIEKSTVDRATKYLIMTLASCCNEKVFIPKTDEELQQVIKGLADFDESRLNLKLKRKGLQELTWFDADVEDNRTEEEKRQDAETAKKQLEALQEEIDTYANGDILKYAEMQKDKYKASTNVFALTITDTDDMAEVEDCHTQLNYYSDVTIRGEIGNVVSDILAIYQSAFQIPITMGKFTGTYVFADKIKGKVGENDSKGVLQLEATGEDGSARLITKHYKGSEVLRWLDNDYAYPITNLKVARHNEVPSLENIMLREYNYYPRFVTRYALGFVKNKKYTNFDKFIKAVKLDLEDRLYKIYTSSVTLPDGNVFSGYDLFDRSKETHRKCLIGAFVNSVMFITGSGAELFDSCQIRCISVLPHSGTSDSYTAFHTDRNGLDRGLSAVASQQFLAVSNRAWGRSILDIIFIKDKDAFYNKTAWAYQELGKIYSTGEIPQISNGESVVIGKQLSGELVDFNLGDNSSFVTSIYAGSRSGKGVTTLSILAAILASKIGIAYIDCKPDMAGCFWDIENRALTLGKRISTYSYDVHASQERYGVYKPYDSLKRACPELANASLAGAMFILKNLQLLTLTGQYKQAHGDSSYMVWVIDEVNNMINMMESGFIALVKDVPADNAKEITATGEYAKKLFDFWKNLTVTIASGVNDTYGQCGYKFIFIGQNPAPMYSAGMPSATLKKDCKGSEPLRIIGNAGSNCYIYGRGLKNINSYGSLSFHNDRDRQQEEKDALEKHRYFVMRKDPKKNGTAGNGISADETLFQPFLTLNTDDVLATCWTGGIGKGKGYNSDIKRGTQEYEQMLVAYKSIMNGSEFGTQVSLSEAVLNNPEVGTGVIDGGTGFFGLLKTYFKSAANTDDEVLKVAAKPYIILTKILTEMQLLGTGSMFGYETIEDFLYDFSEEALELTNYDVYLDKLATFEKKRETQEYASVADTIDADYDIPESCDNTEIEDIAEPIDDTQSNFTDDTHNTNSIPNYTDNIYHFTDSDVLNKTKNSTANTKPIPTVRELKNENSYTSRYTMQPADVLLRRGIAEDATTVNSEGYAESGAYNYETLIREALPDLEEGYYKHSKIGFVDKAMVKKNIRDRYKTLVKAVDATIGWERVEKIVMTSSEFAINGQIVQVQTLGADGYNIYETLDFADLLFKKAIRLKYLLVSEDINDMIISDCGADVYETLFSHNLILQQIQIGNTKVPRTNRSKTMKMAFEAEMEKAATRSKVKDAFIESCFASGTVKKTQANMATASRIVSNAKKSNNRNTNISAIKRAKAILNMTLPELVLMPIIGTCLAFGGLLHKARNMGSV